MRILAFAVSLMWMLLYAADIYAQCGDAACAHAGTAAVSISTSQSQLLDSTMSSELGTAVDLSQAQHQALTNASVNVSSLLSQITNSGLATSANAALTQPLTVSQLANSIGDTLKAGGNNNAANAAYALGTQSSGVSGQQTLTTLLTGEKSASVLTQSNVNALDLLSAVVATNNLNTQRTAQTVNTTGAALGLGVNIGAITLSVVVVDRPTFVCGPTGSKFYSASVRVRARVALANSGVNLNLGIAAIVLTLTQLDLVVAVGRASGTLTAINALTSAITVQATPGVAELYFGTVSDTVLQNRAARIDQTKLSDLGYASLATAKVTVLGASSTASIDARGYAAGTAPVPTNLMFSGTLPQTKSATTSATFVTTLVNTLLS